MSQHPSLREPGNTSLTSRKKNRDLAFDMPKVTAGQRQSWNLTLAPRPLLPSHTHTHTHTPLELHLHAIPKSPTVLQALSPPCPHILGAFPHPLPQPRLLHLTPRTHFAQEACSQVPDLSFLLGSRWEGLSLLCGMLKSKGALMTGFTALSPIPHLINKETKVLGAEMP